MLRKHLLRPLIASAVIFMPLSGIAEETAVEITEDQSAIESSPQIQQELPLQDLRTFTEIFERIRSSYVEEVDDKTLFNNAIKGMLNSLDPHSSYLQEEDFSDLQENTSGKFGGLGIEVGMENGLVRVITPIDDTPAQRAGIRTGDLIVSLDGEPVMGLSLSDAVELMRGQPGTPITLEVRRKGESDLLSFTIERAEIKVASVRTEMLDGEIGYVRLTQFQENTGTELQEALRAWKEDTNLNGVILDMRNNPGGVLQAAVVVVDTFISEGLIVYTEGRSPMSDVRYEARAETLMPDIPIVVLINGGSASASEKSLINGLVGLLATGGSTNHAIHLIAIAKAAGIIINWQDMSDLSKLTPLLTRIYPNGSADINHFQASGGMPLLMRELSEAGLLHQDVETVMGSGLSAYFNEPKLKENQSSEIYRQNSTTDESRHIVDWSKASQVSLDETVIRPASRPFSKNGGLQLLTGNIGRSVIKTSAVAEENLVIEAEAVVFDDQNDLVTAFEKQQLNKDFIAVIRFQGPKSNGMPELHKLTPILSSLQSKGFAVALITDGRMSGASGKVPAAIHLVPEALEGGNIARIQNGDKIRLDANCGELQLFVSEEELANRKLATKTDYSDQTGLGRELFNSFRNVVSSAENGACNFE